MNISLTPELEKFIHHEVKGGLYQSASEVVRAGLRRLKEDKDRKPSFSVSSLEELEDKLSEGVEQLERGDGIPGDQVFSELRKRNADFRKAKR
jgi:antitoxin ParD1/3/4